MTGTLAQIIAMTSYGNAYLITGNLPVEFISSNTTFQFCKTIEFIDFKKPFFFSKLNQIVVASSPTDWLQMLKDGGCRKLRLYFQYSKDQGKFKDHQLAGMVGGGGTWLIEAIYSNYSNYWASRWEVIEQNAPDRKIWKVTYGLTFKKDKTVNIQVDLGNIKQEINQTLTEIADFAFKHNYEVWGKQFEKAKSTLASDNPSESYYHKDLIITANYSLTSQQVLFCAGSSWVFGGMGSWNDLIFKDKSDNAKYEELSAKLYDNINQSILASVNSY